MLDQLIAFNDEITALARAGIPLESGLRAAAEEMPRRLSRVASQVSGQLAEGASLVEVMQRHSDVFPPAYRAIVAAGLAGGNLPSALEQVAAALRRLRELREMVVSSLIYPLVVAGSAYLLLIISLFTWGPQLADAHRDLLREPGLFQDLVDRLRGSVMIWGPLVPLLVALHVIAWLYWSNRAAWGWVRMPGRGWARLREEGQQAVFLEVLGILVHHGQPLPEALVLAGAASGQPRLEREARELADQLRTGSAAISPKSFRALPGLLAWRLQNAGSTPRLAVAVRRMAEAYRRRAQRRAGRLALLYPLVASVGIGASAVVLYGIWTFAPWFYLLLRMTHTQ